MSSNSYRAADRSPVKAYLQLMRPANIVTAMADILAGFAVAYGFLFANFFTGSNISISANFFELLFGSLAGLLLSTIGLYGGGVVFNDVFDAELDAVERPERPIPSGRASYNGALLTGITLLLIGIMAAFWVSLLSGVIAVGITILALIYNKYGKHTALGPINMGMCRGLNLLLGVSVMPGQFDHFWYISLIPIVYIAAITAISRGEVHGGNQKTIKLAVSLYSMVILAIVGLSITSGTSLWQTLPFLLLFAYLIFPPVFKAIQEPLPRNIGMAVKAGVISLIVMDAALAASFAGWLYGLLVLALLPLSRLLAKKFAVT